MNATTMIRALAVAAALYAAGCSDAQTTTPPPTNDVPATLPKCWPSNLGGSGTAIAGVRSGDGQGLGWWCASTDPGVQPVQVGVVWLNSYRLIHPSTVTGVPWEVAKAYWQANVKAKILSPELLAVQAALRERLADTRPPVVAAPPPAASAPPPARLDVVAPNPIAGKPAGAAQVYIWILDKLAPWNAVTATVGAACDCTATRLVEGKRYCTFVGAPSRDMLAVCEAK